MLRSTDRILTTHAGSLPRAADWLAMFSQRDTADPEALAARGRQAVADVARQQLALGIDVISDGEQGKPSFVSYVNDRLGGFEPAGARTNPWAGSREVQAFPEFYESQARANSGGASGSVQMVCTGPITYRGGEQLRSDIENFKAALTGVNHREAFMPAISPANIENWHTNRHYRDDEEFLYAIAEAMNVEYRAIVDAGFLLQIDDPRLATYYVMNPTQSIADCRKWAEKRVGALNHALRDIPEDRVRYHTCYSINMGPRVHDMEMKDLVRIIVKIKAGAYSFEAANPRHEHEWQVWEGVKLPPGKSIIPGVISHTTVLVEHPELVAQRLVRFAQVVGRENVIGGNDCGFATFAGSNEIHPSIAWAKLGALVEGARRASRELWPRRKPAGRKAAFAVQKKARKATPKTAKKTARKKASSSRTRPGSTKGRRKHSG